MMGIDPGIDMVSRETTQNVLREFDVRFFVPIIFVLFQQVLASLDNQIETWVATAHF